MKLAVKAKPSAPRISPVAPGGIPETPRWAHRAAATLIVLAVLLAYANTFSAPLVLDDYYSITENPTIRQLWPPGPAFSPPAKSGTGGRPLANFTFAVSYALSGNQPWGHHAVSVGVHALAALALFGVVRRTLLRPALRERFAKHSLGLAATIAVIWAVHPLQTQVVTYVSQRTESLMALFYLSTLYCFIRGTETRPRMWHGLAIVTCLLGMACKEVMVTAPLMVLLYDRVFVAGSWSAACRQRWRLYLGLAGTWLLLGWLMIGVKERDVGFGLGASAFDYALTACKAVVLYVRLGFWPQPLIFDRGPVLVKSVAEAWPWILGVVVLLAAAIAAWRRKAALGFLAAWFFIALAPTTSVVPVVQQPIAENRPHLALAALVAWVVVGLYSRFGAWMLAVCGGLATVAAVATLNRNRDYASEVGLWRDTVDKAPGNVRAQHNLGAALQKSGLAGEAIAAFEASLALDPTYFYAHVSLGNALCEQGRDPEAIAHFQAALRLEPRLPKACVNLGIALFRTGKTAEAITQFERGVAMDPGSPDARYNLGTALSLSGRMAEAVPHFRSAVALDPRQMKAWNSLGLALQQLGQIEDAMRQFEQALRVDPNNADAHLNLGTALGNGGRLAEAIGHWETALRLNPQSTLARDALAQAKQLQRERTRQP